MIVINDVWVNWFEGEEKGYNVCPFFEWRKQDKIQLIDKIPILYVEKRMYQYIENDLDDLPGKLLNMIQNRTIIKGEVIKYAAIVTDGEGILAFDTMGYHLPLKKSRLIPRHERRILQVIRNQPQVSFPLKRKVPVKTDHPFSLGAEAMVGLIRRERELKWLTMLVLDQLKEGKNCDEIHYWLTEWEPDQYHEIRQLSFQEAWQRLYRHIYKGWSKKHEDFCQEIVKGHLLFEQLWERANMTNDDVVMRRIK
ncbi:YjbA family protein [Amphibacillus sp. MSJ-3]|uniref:DUF3603 family protein n=1 Tax=Amphibacillus sp. MSJ-3 TaxID=2841505 RepID=UPI001C0F3A47|nr:DUF3603 family protein [Amphibacillus sp. MSJ-3]MBU5595217.1 YjbA family protein [Amphibacillus sp. MSJ-3]